jgi:hypothetical protein
VTRAHFDINKLWSSHDEQAWLNALATYSSLIKASDQDLVELLEPLDLGRISRLTRKGWYRFLDTEYFRWKYTAANRLASTRKSLQTYLDADQLDDLFDIKRRLLRLSPDLIGSALDTAGSIRGLGIAGASGLLALLYPDYFATVDQFAVKALKKVKRLPEHVEIEGINPDRITRANGVLLIGIMRAKAARNNTDFETTSWTPRMIDQILWASG